MPEYDPAADYGAQKDDLASKLIAVNKAWTAFESFRENDPDFDRLERTIRELSYSANLLSFARRGFKKTLAKKGERS